VGGQRGDTQDFFFAGRSATQQGAGRNAFGCPVHKLLWWLLKCLKPWKCPQTPMQITLVCEHYPTVVIAKEIHVQSPLPELVSSETSLTFAGQGKRKSGT